MVYRQFNLVWSISLSNYKCFLTTWREFKFKTKFQEDVRIGI